MATSIDDIIVSLAQIKMHLLSDLEAAGRRNLLTSLGETYFFFSSASH